MKRRGQVALYLLLVLVGLVVLMLMNVGVFLSVRAKNRTMNAADAASLAVARHQMGLLNEIGELNREHLRVALGLEEGDAETCHEIVLRQMRLCFIGPLAGIREGSTWAQMNGAEADPEAADIFRQHVFDIRDEFINNPDLFPPPYDRVTGETAKGCDWETYAQALESQLGDMVAAPNNAEFADEIDCPPLMSKEFYLAAQNRAWCWFKAYGYQWTLGRSTQEMPSPFLTKTGVRWNSEIYSLHLRFASWHEMGFGDYDETWTNLVMKLADCTAEDIARSTLITNDVQTWAFYDRDVWRDWSEIDIDAPGRLGGAFPVVGRVKAEYNVKGCEAQCRVKGTYTRFLEAAKEGSVAYQPKAKPFGTVENLEGEVDRVMALGRFVTPAFREVRLVPVDHTGGEPTRDTGDAAWQAHVRHIRNGVQVKGCGYCRVLEKWDDPAYRSEGTRWLDLNGTNCAIPVDGTGLAGGNSYGY